MSPMERYKQNYRFEYLDLNWNEYPVTIDDKDTNQKTKNILWLLGRGDAGVGLQ